MLNNVFETQPIGLKIGDTVLLDTGFPTFAFVILLLTSPIAELGAVELGPSTTLFEEIPQGKSRRILIPAIIYVCAAADKVESVLEELTDDDNSTEIVEETHYSVKEICNNLGDGSARQMMIKCRQKLFPPMYEAAVKMEGDIHRVIIDVPMAHQNNEISFPCDMWLDTVETHSSDEVIDKEKPNGNRNAGVRNSGNSAGRSGGRAADKRTDSSQRRKRAADANTARAKAAATAHLHKVNAGPGGSPTVAVLCSVKIKDSEDILWHGPKMVTKNRLGRWPGTINHGQIDRLLQNYIRQQMKSN